MSLRCGNCSAAFFSQKLLDRHQQKCSSIAGKTRFMVSVRVPEDDSGGGGAASAKPPLFASADQLCDHYTSVHVKPMSTYIVETTAAAVAAAAAGGGGGDTLYECGGCKARYKDRMLLEAHFQAGCPSLTSGGADDPQEGDDVAMSDAVDDAYLHASVMSASISA